MPHSEATQYLNESFKNAVAAFFDVPIPDGQASQKTDTTDAVEQTTATSMR